MADSILRLKVESQEYDNKLKRAAEGIQRLASKIHDSQGEFVGLENEQKEFIKNLQYMNTVSQTATGKVKELETAYKGLQTMYNGFNAFEKNSEEGKILAEQLSILKEKTLQARKEMEDANKSLSNTGGFLDQLTSKFTVNIDALKLFDIGMNAAGAALDVAKDAFFASEATVDEWGRVMDSSKSLYEGFLTSLNTGDISGFLNRIDSIVQAARAAYDELDRLGTMKTIQAPQMSAQQTENERMRMMIQTGRYIAPVDGRRASMQNGQLLTPDQIKRIEQQLQGGMQKVVTLVGNEVAQTGRAIDAVYNRQAQELGMSLKEFRKGTSSMAEFDKRMAGYDQYQKWRAEHTTIDMQSGRETVARGNPFEQFAKWGTFRVDGDRYNDLVKLIQQRDQQAGSLYGMQSQAYRTMNRAEGVTLRQIMGGGSGGGGGHSGRSSSGSKSEPTYAADSIAAQQKLVADLTRQWNEAGAEVRNQYVVPIVEAEAKLKSMQNEMGLQKENAAGKLLGDTPDGKAIEIPISSDIAFETWMAGVKEKLAGLKLDPIEIPIETTEKDVRAIAMAARTTADVVGSIGDAFSAIEDPAGKVMGTVMQAIASVALGYAQATVEATSMGPWAWVAFAASGLATMLTMISTIHSATGYAEGGIVGGNSYSGDNVFAGNAMVNSGELILNHAQQNAVASELQSGPRAIHVTGRLRGSDIVLSIDRELQQSGRGQLLTWG